MYPSLLERLKSQHESVSELIAGLDGKRLAYQPKPDKWSIKDNIAHLACYQPIFLERLNRIVKEDEPSFERYKAEDDPGFASWQARPMHELLSALRSDREKIVKFCTQLDPASLKRCGMHLKYGKLTLVQWLDFFVLHEAHHLFTIFQLAHDQDGNQPAMR